MIQAFEYPHNTSFVFYVCIDTKTNEDFVGSVYPFSNCEIIKFSTFDDFLVQMDTYMDEYGPQSHQDKRTLNECKNKKTIAPNMVGVVSENCLFQQKGSLKTYVLCMISRKDTEWQGCVYEHDKLVESFSNILDLANIIT